MEENLTPVAESAASPENDENVIRSARKAYSRCERNLGLYLAISMTVVTVVSLIYMDITERISVPMKIAYLISFASMYGLGFPIYLLLSFRSEVSKPKKKPFSVSQFLLFLLMSESVMFIGNIIGLLFTTVGGGLLGIKLTDTTIQTAVLGEKSILFIVIATTLGPVIEELLFRKVFIDRVRKYGDGKAIIVSGVLFGLFHGNFTQVFYAAGFGILLGYVYVTTGRIRNTIALHMTLNITGSLVPMLLMSNVNYAEFMAHVSLTEATKYFQEHLSDFLPIIGWELFIISVVIAGAVLLSVRLATKKFKLDPPEVPIPKGKLFSVTCVSFGMLVFLALTVFQFYTSIT